MTHKITPPQLADAWGISVDKIHSWILSGELQAINAATRSGGKPRYLIDVEDLADFERRRQVQPPARQLVTRIRREVTNAAK